MGGELEMSTRRNISSITDQTCDIFHVLVTFNISLLQESPALQCTEGSTFFLLINRSCGENCHIQWHKLPHSVAHVKAFFYVPVGMSDTDLS